MSGNTSRNKGANGERELVHKFRDFYGLNIRRGDCFRGEPDIVGVSPAHPEVKRSETPNVWDWIRQAEAEMEEKKDGDHIVIFFRRNRGRWLAITPFVQWIKMKGPIIEGFTWHVGKKTRLYEWAEKETSFGFAADPVSTWYLVCPLEVWADTFITWREYGREEEF